MHVPTSRPSSIAGNATEARAILDEILPECRVVFGDDHDVTLAVIGNLGAAELRLRQLEAAEAHLREALKGKRLVLGDDNPDTLSTLSNLALVPAVCDKPADAQALLRKIYETRLRVQGKAHPDTVAAAINLAMNLYHLQKYKESIDLFCCDMPDFRRPGIDPEVLGQC